MWPFRSQRRDVVLESVPDQRFRFFGGRQHLAAMPYPLPKDMDEINRLDFQHFLLRTGLRGNFAAPIGQPTDILDVGCGSGRWAMEVAALFPQGRVIGFDLVPPPDDANPLGRDSMSVPGTIVSRLGTSSKDCLSLIVVSTLSTSGYSSPRFRVIVGPPLSRSLCV